MKACGIFKKFLDNYMNAEPYIPQPKENVNKPLVFMQLMMLWLMWISGLTAGIIAFFGELTAGGFTTRHKQITWTRQRKDNTIQPMTQMTQNPVPIDTVIHGNGKDDINSIKDLRPRVSRGHK